MSAKTSYIIELVKHCLLKSAIIAPIETLQRTKLEKFCNAQFYRKLYINRREF